MKYKLNYEQSIPEISKLLISTGLFLASDRTPDVLYLSDLDSNIAISITRVGITWWLPISNTKTRNSASFQDAFEKIPKVIQIELLYHMDIFTIYDAYL